jgi:hypothetical protein
MPWTVQPYIARGITGATVAKGIYVPELPLPSGVLWAELLIREVSNNSGSLLGSSAGVSYWQLRQGRFAGGSDTQPVVTTAMHQGSVLSGGLFVNGSVTGDARNGRRSLIAFPALPSAAPLSALSAAPIFSGLPMTTIAARVGRGATAGSPIYDVDLVIVSGGQDDEDGNLVELSPIDMTSRIVVAA